MVLLRFSPVSLLTELDAFYTEHRMCGELDMGTDERAVWIECACGARIVKRADVKETKR
jgi:hypothetical protein